MGKHVEGDTQCGLESVMKKLPPCDMVSHISVSLCEIAINSFQATDQAGLPSLGECPVSQEERTPKTRDG